jgi:hypothetical protein
MAKGVCLFHWVILSALIEPADLYSWVSVPVAVVHRLKKQTANGARPERE